MLNFTWYMLFSGLEFLSVFLLIFSFFNLNLKFYVKEILVSVIVVTLTSYFLVRMSIDTSVSIPIILVLVIAFLLIYFFKIEKKAYAIIISIGGSIIYGLIQFLVGTLAVLAGGVTSDELTIPFSNKTYLLQITCAFVAITISYFVRITNGGFGFMIRGGNYKKFLLLSILFLVIMGVATFGFYLRDSLLSIIIVLITFLILALSFFVLAYERDRVEYNS